MYNSTIHRHANAVVVTRFLYSFGNAYPRSKDPLYPSISDYRFQAYSALAMGQKGLWWWFYTGSGE